MTKNENIFIARVTFQAVNQLESHGINAWQEIANAAGVTVPEVRRLCETGQLPASAEARFGELAVEHSSILTRKDG